MAKLIDRLQQRWQLRNGWQVMWVLLVFACTGFTVLFIKRPLLHYLFAGEPLPLWASFVYYILILPVYNVILLFYGLLFGQFRFFWEFEKRFFARILSIFNRSKGKP